MLVCALLEDVAVLDGIRCVPDMFNSSEAVQLLLGHTKLESTVPHIPGTKSTKG